MYKLLVGLALPILLWLFSAVNRAGPWTTSYTVQITFDSLCHGAQSVRRIVLITQLSRNAVCVFGTNKVTLN